MAGQITRKLQRISTAEAVVNYFKEQIRDGALKPGDKLPSERLLQRDLGVSRFSLREGLARLNALGIVRVSQGSGAFVEQGMSHQSLEDVMIPLFPGHNPDRLRELMEARALLESEVSALAAQRRSEDDLNRLQAILDRSRKEIDNPDTFGLLDFEFHRAIAEIAGNAFLLAMTEAIAAHVRTFLQQLARNEKSRTDALANHQEILGCIHSRDSETLRRVTRGHIQVCLDNFTRTPTDRKDADHE